MDSDDSALFSFDVPSTSAIKTVSKLTPKKKNQPKSKSRTKHSPTKASKNGKKGATKATTKAGATKGGSWAKGVSMSDAKHKAGGSPKKGAAKVSSKTPSRPHPPKRPRISGMNSNVHNVQALETASYFVTFSTVLFIQCYRMAGNFRGVLIFVIFVVDSAVTKISTHEN